LKFVQEFLRCLEQRPITLNFQNFVPQVFTASPIDVVLFKFRKIRPTEKIGEIARYLPDKKIRLRLKLSVLRGWRPKSARASPRKCT